MQLRATLLVLPLLLASLPASAQPELPAPQATGEVSIQRVSEAGRVGGIGTAFGALHAESVRIEDLLPSAYEVTPDRLVIETDLPPGKYDVVVRPEDGDIARALREALESRFGLEAIRQTPHREVYLLKRTADWQPSVPGLLRAKTGKAVSYCNGTVIGSDLTAAKLAEFLAGHLGRPVVDKTGWSDPLVVDLEWDQESAETLAAELRAEVGFDLVEGFVPIEQVVIRSAAGPFPLHP